MSKPKFSRLGVLIIVCCMKFKGVSLLFAVFLYLKLINCLKEQNFLKLNSVVLGIIEIPLRAKCLYLTKMFFHIYFIFIIIILIHLNPLVHKFIFKSYKSQFVLKCSQKVFWITLTVYYKNFKSWRMCH